MHRKDDWKESSYAFVPHQTHFGELCGFADDVVNAGQGFGMHPHRDMEITTILASGSQAHKDNTGGQGLIDSLCVQTMSAGTGILHSEYNASQTEPFHSFQIWVYPKKLGVKPRHEKFKFQENEKRNKILLALSPDGRNGSASINQDAYFSLSKMDAELELDYPLHQKDSGVYIHCVTGCVEMGDFRLETGDALGIYETTHVKIHANKESELILVEVPMKRGIQE